MKIVGKKIISVILSLVMAIGMLAIGTGSIKTSAICCRKDNFDKSRYTLTGNMAHDVAMIAKSQKGRTCGDFGYSGVDYGAWCDEFVADCIENAGGDSSIVAHGSTVEDFEEKMRARGALPVTSPKEGDLIFFTISHVEIVTKVENGVVYSAGGNNGKSPGSCAGERSWGTARLYLRPNYPTTPEDTTPPTWETYPSYNGVLLKGSVDDAEKRVSFIQTSLYFLGFNCGTVDGKFGTNTENAVKSFQQKYGLSVDGRVDQETWNKLVEEVTNAKTASKYANLGDDFYAVILNKACWKPISQVENSDFVTLVTETGDPRQVWRFQRQPDGAYSIRSCYDGKALEMHNGNGAAIGTQISAWDDYWGGFYQQWYIVPQSGGCVLLSKHYTDKNRVMELKNNNSDDGTAIQINERNNSDAQIWSIYSFDEVQLKPTTLSVNVDSPKVTFTWPNVYGVKDYNLRISKNKEGGTFLDLWKTSSGVSLDLPAGTYQAYVDGAHYFTWKQSNIVTFTVSNVDYSVTYNGNGGANIPAKQTKSSCVTLKLSNTIPTKNGYKFVNWNTKSDGKGTSYSPGSNYTTNSNLTLYAQWQAEKYIVNFNLNGGTCSTSSKQVIYGNPYGDLPTPTKQGYKFVGWYTSALGGEKINSSSKVSNSSNHTLHAQWSCLHNSYTSKITKSPTCTATGITTYTCECGDSYTKTISATGKHTGGTATCKAKAICTVCKQPYGELAKHKEVTVAGTPATYTTEGKTEGKKCSVCNTVTLAQKTIEKLTLGKVDGLKAKKVKVAKKSEITLTWTSLGDGVKYEVYVKNGKKWTKLTTTSKTSYTVKKDGKKKYLKADKEYQFRVRAVVEDIKGKYSSTLKVETIPSTATLKLKAGKKQFTASWSSVSGISGYEVQYSTSKKMKSAKTVNAKKSAKKTTIKKLKKGKKYFVRVRAYKTVDGKKIYSDWSKVKNVKVK